MIGDKSKDFEATWEFLERRIDDVNNAGSNINFVRISITCNKNLKFKL
jgi:hypothetical protein